MEIEDATTYTAAPNVASFVVRPGVLGHDLRDVLRRHGVAIIPNVLNQEECQAMNDGAWDFYEAITAKLPVPLKRDDQTTWRSIHDLYLKHGMLNQHWGIGHAPYLWKLRQNPKIIAPFARLWATRPEDLLVSFDGASLGLPPEVTNRGWFRNEWYHFDQKLSVENFDCVQSWVTANDVMPGDATLTVLEGSHAVRREFTKRHTVAIAEDWFKLTEDHVQWFKERGCVARDICCTAGSMVFWDSRTAHAGKEPVKGRESPNIRNVAYLCYTARDRSSKGNLTKRRKYYEEGRTTSHSPHHVKVFPIKPRTYGGALPPVVEQPIPELDDIGKRLVGY